MFVHTHLHTQFSNYKMHDAISDIDSIIRKVDLLNQPGFAITDHNGTSGLIEAYVHLEKYNKANNKNLKLIFGSELYYTNDVTVKEKKLRHILFLAKNNKGLENLYHLVSEAHQHYYYKSRIDLDIIKKYSEGLICTSACMGGWLRNENKDYLLKELKNIFHDDLYLEIHTYQHKEQLEYNRMVIDLAKQHGIKTIACCDSHYVNPEDYALHKAFRGVSSSDEDTYYQSNDFYIMSEQEVKTKLSYLPADIVEESINNTMEIFNKCNVTIEFGQKLYPTFAAKGNAKELFLEELRKGYKEKILGKYHGEEKKKIDERICHEIDILEKVNYFDYLLITKDIWDNAKKAGIPVGYGRGSVSNCQCAYLLGLTTLDSITNNLYFERFANPDRISPADVDLDVSRVKRKQVVDYIKEKYGYAYQCRTFNYLKAKGALHKAGISLDVPFPVRNALSKQIPDTQGFDKDVEIKKLDDIKTPENTELIELAKKFVGIMDGFGKHASCVIVSNQDIRKFCSLERQIDSETHEEVFVASCNFKYLEKIGLLKEDILGLRTLDVIQECLSYLDEPIDVNKLPWVDEKTTDLLSKGDTLGVFQMKSPGMIETLKAMKPKGFLDMITVVGVYRPACIDTGMLQEYLERRNGKPFTYPSESIKHILSETCGIMIFQEQIMAIVQAVAGYSMSEADTVRRAVGKKDKELMAETTAKFVERAVAHGTDRKLAEEILGEIVASASYSFSKGHSQSYGYISWITAYLKAHYPLQLYVASINSLEGNHAKIIPYIDEMKLKGIKILPPDLRFSANKWTIENDCVRIGLSYLKGIGNIEKPSEYTMDSIFSMYNKMQLQALILSGALDFLGQREHLYYIIDSFKKNVKRKEQCLERMAHYEKQKKDLEQQALTEVQGALDKQITTCTRRYNEWKEKLSAVSEVEEIKGDFNRIEGELEILGLTFTDALSEYDTSLDNGNNVRAVIVTGYEKRTTRNGKEMANINTLDGGSYVMFEPLEKLEVNKGYYIAINNRNVIIKTKMLQKAV